MVRNDHDGWGGPRRRQAGSVAVNRLPGDYSRRDRQLVLGCTGADPFGAHRQGAVTIVMNVIDVDIEKRWTAWKLEGARLDAIRASRMRKLFMTMGLTSVLWLLWRL
jgi:hypothetical protein